MTPGNCKYKLPLFGGIYSKDIIVFRDTEAKKYQFLDQPYKMSMVAVAALPNPKLNEKHTLMSEEDFEKTCGKMKTILALAASNGHDSIVLSKK